MAGAGNGETKIFAPVAGAENYVLNKDPPEANDGNPQTLEKENKDRFITPQKSRRPNFIPKDEIFRNITAILDGFEHDRRQNK